MKRVLLLMGLLLLLANPVSAQTRFYCSDDDAAAVNPAFGSAWETTASAVRRAATTTRPNDGFTTITQNADAAGGTVDLLYMQCVSDQLSATTLTGTISGVFRIMASNAGNWTGGIGNWGFTWRLSKSASDGSSVTEIVALTISTGTLLTTGTLTNNQLRDTANDLTVTIPSTGINANDRLIFEIGLSEATTNTARTGSIEIGDDNTTDLAANDTGTTQDTPYFEVSQTLSFGGGGGGATCSGGLTMLGAGKCD